MNTEIKHDEGNFSEDESGYEDDMNDEMNA